MPFYGYICDECADSDGVGSEIFDIDQEDLPDDVRCLICGDLIAERDEVEVMTEHVEVLKKAVSYWAERAREHDKRAEFLQNQNLGLGGQIMQASSDIQELKAEIERLRPASPRIAVNYTDPGDEHVETRSYGLLQMQAPDFADPDWGI